LISVILFANQGHPYI